MTVWVLSVFAQSNTQKVKLNFDIQKGTVDSSKIVIAKNGKEWKTIIPENPKKRMTTESIELDYQYNYLFTFYKPGYVSKTVGFDTHIPENHLNRKIPPFDFNITIHKLVSGNKPIERKTDAFVKYNERLYVFEKVIEIDTAKNKIIFGQKLPIIKATSKKVDVRDGAKFKKSHWVISPETRPDIYETLSKNGNITFYTDKDSISFPIILDKKYDFVILLNNKDSAFTEIICPYSSTHDSIYCHHIKGKWAVSINTGYSLIKLGIYGFDNQEAAANTVLPPGIASIDYGISKKSNIGFTFAYQAVTGYIYNGDQTPLLNVNEYINRSNIGIRYLRFGKLCKDAVFYYGVQAGMAIWNDKIVSTNPYHPTSEFGPINGSSWVGYNYQVFCGWRIYLNNSLAMNFGFGIGTPYLLEGGLTYIH